MASSSFFSSSSPTVVLTPQHVPDQYFHEGHYRPVENAPTPGFAAVSAVANVSGTPSLPPTPSEGAIAGRKRSRGDVYCTEDEQFDRATFNAQPMPQSLDLSDQIEPSHSEAAPVASRPILPTRKSQRLDTSAGSPNDTTSSRAPVVPRLPGSEPLIDEATRMLGVSWTRLDLGENNQIKQRAFTRWISRHYPFLSNVELWFENSAIPGYLGKATPTETGVEEFYLWSFDLHQAILVTRQPSDLIIKLSQPHMSVSQAVDIIKADLEPVVEAAAANASILHNDRYLIDEQPISGGMELD